MLHIAPDEVFSSARMSKVDDLLKRARAHREMLLKRLAEAEAAIEALENLKRRVPASALSLLFESPEVEKGIVEPMERSYQERPLTPDEVVPVATQHLLEIGRPMKRGELARALQAKGVALAGKDINKNLGTILWRQPAYFVSIEGRGYWVKGVPLDGVYDPDRDDEPLPKTTFVPIGRN